MNLLTLRTRTQERLNAETAAPYSVANIAASLNEGQRLFALLSLCVERTRLLPLLADRPLFALHDEITDWLVPLRVKCIRRTLAPGALWDGTLWDEALWDQPDAVLEAITPVRPKTLLELDATNPAWKLDRDPIVTSYGCHGLDAFFIHPAPADADTRLRLVYAAQPATMAAEVLSVGDQFYDNSIHGVVVNADNGGSTAQVRKFYVKESGTGNTGWVGK